MVYALKMFWGCRLGDSGTATVALIVVAVGLCICFVDMNDMSVILFTHNKFIF